MWDLKICRWEVMCLTSKFHLWITWSILFFTLKENHSSLKMKNILCYFSLFKVLPSPLLIRWLPLIAKLCWMVQQSSLLSLSFPTAPSFSLRSWIFEKLILGLYRILLLSFRCQNKSPFLLVMECYVLNQKWSPKSLLYSEVEFFFWRGLVHSATTFISRLVHWWVHSWVCCWEVGPGWGKQTAGNMI